MVPLYSWIGGTWNRGQIVPGVWYKRRVLSVNTWSSVVNTNIVMNYVNQAISLIIGNVLMHQYNCYYRPLFPLLKSIACKCGINVGPECGSLNSQDAVLGQQTASCSQNVTIYAGGSIITLNSDSIQNCSTVFSLVYGSRSGNPDTSVWSSTNSTQKRDYMYLKKRYDSTTIPSPCYAIVQNNYSAYIGQLRGDCVSFTPSGPVSNIEICTVIKASIPADAGNYPNLGIALSSTDSSKTVRYYASSVISSYSKGSFLCAIVNQGGIFCPVSLMNNWSSITSRPQPVCNVASQALSIITMSNQVLAGSATKIAFATQPIAKMQAGIVSGNIVVKFLDSNGNVASDSKASVTLNLISSIPGSSLIGTVRQSASSGVVTFNDITVNLVGQDYVLQAISGNFAPIISTTFNVTAGPSAALLFTTQPVFLLYNFRLGL